MPDLLKREDQWQDFQAQFTRLKNRLFFVVG